MSKLRPYQQECLEAIQERFHARGSTLAVMATGTGKTVVFSHLAKARAVLGRTMIVAHREELIEQAADKVSRIAGLPVEIEMADRWASDGTMFGKCPIVVGSIQSLCSGRRIERFNSEEFSTLIVDEAHHSVSNTYTRVIDYFKSNSLLRILGVTATPDRKDEEALGQVFETVAYDYEIVDAVLDGWLVKPLCRTVRLTGLDLSGVKTTAGDFNQRQLAEELSRHSNLEAIAAATVEHSGGRRTLVFADSVSEAVRDDDGAIVARVEGNAPKLTVMLNGHKPGSARLIHGGTPSDERKRIIDDYRGGRFQYLVNVGIATEGFDVPDIACVALARPTKSRALCAQMVGRGTRPASSIADELGTLPTDVARRQRIAASEKPDLLVIDFVDNTDRHDLIHPANILGGRVSERAVELVEKQCQGKPTDLIAALDAAESLIRHNDELAAAARDRRGVRAVGRSTLKDPFAAYGLQRRERRALEPVGPMDDVQRAKLERWKIKGYENLDWTGAQQIIEEYQRRVRNGLCTIKQAALLRRYGHNDAVSFQEAREVIDQIAANGWKK